ncbi:Protein Y41C4A.9 [Aphelenchoides avenae]|nr:Protein Y41C4A.9 [Aphelenchus avenae]
MRTRQLVIANKKRLDALSEKGELTDDDIEKARDQGLARPKVLILSAYKKHAHEIVQGLTKLVFGEGDRTHVLNSQRFEGEFGDDGSRLHEKRNAPDDYRDLMAGNTDDCFRIGIGLAKKSLKLYTKFSEADILLCSPLGLRMVIGDETEEKREYDFLASIEVLIIDKAHILLMQNWEHLTNILQTVNSIPAQVDVDISRVRHWSLKHLAKYYRQTVAFSDVNFSELHALFSHYCHNYAGQVTLTEAPESILPQIEVPIVQELHRFDVTEPQNQSDYRFNYFVKEILPKCEHGTAVFVSSYFDYVRLRNYLKKESESFVQLHEYAKDAKIAKGRGLFYNGHKKMMLITERFHFFRRYHVRGIKSLVFYQMPVNAHFYTELINMTVPEGKLYSRLLFCKYDLLRLQNVFGAKEGKQLVTSPKKFHALVGE